MRDHRIWVVIVIFLFALPSAHAGGSASKERAARKACLRGDVAKGVDLLTDLYIDSKDPTYIFNQGRCYEQNLLYEQALARFREYLVKAPRLSAADRAEVEKRISTCQSYLVPEKSQPPVAEPPNPVPPPPPPPIPAATASPAVAQPEATVSSVALAPANPSRPGTRAAAIVAAAIGGAALVGGVIINVKVDNMAHDLEKQGAYSRSKESDRKTYQTLGWVSYGVGAACLATGAVLYLLGRNRPQGTATTVAVLPGLVNGNLGATLEGSF